MNKTVLQQFTTLLLYLSSLLVMLPAQAGTFENLHFIGFSSDGRHLAFETYGTSDGTGHGFSKITIIDVASNAWESRPVKTGTESDMFTEEQARSKNRAKVAAKLSDLGIVDGVTGDHVVSRLLTDLTVYNEPIRFAKAVYSSFQKGDFELQLTEKPVSSAECAVHTPPGIKIFELSLKNRKTNNAQVLQKDTRLPRSRYCPFQYRVSDVYVSNDRLVVFLNMFGPGFEGRSMSYLAVTVLIP